MDFLIVAVGYKSGSAADTSVISVIPREKKGDKNGMKFMNPGCRQLQLCLLWQARWALEPPNCLLFRLYAKPTGHNVNITHECCQFLFPFESLLLFQSQLLPPVLLHYLPCGGSVIKVRSRRGNIPAPFCLLTVTFSPARIVLPRLLILECSAAARGESRKCARVRLREWKWSSRPRPMGTRDCSLLCDRIIALYGLLSGK